MASKDSLPNGGNCKEDDGSTRKNQGGNRRSLHELEEEIVRLRNENFNLKLRLHFKEQAHEETAQRGESYNALVKELDEAKALIQALREELIDKTQLLRDAAVAITEHEEREHEFVIESQAKIAVLESCLAQMQQKESSSSASSYFDFPMPDEMSEDGEQMRHHEALAKIETLQQQLILKDVQMEDYDQKLKKLSIKNSELKDLLEQHNRFSQMAKQLMKTQKMQLQDCLVEKQAFVERMTEMVPELNCHKEILEEAKLAVQRVLDSTDLKSSALRQSRLEARQKVPDVLRNWAKKLLEGSATSDVSHVDSDVSLPEVAGDQPQPASVSNVEAEAEAEAEDEVEVEVEVGGAASPSRGKLAPAHSKSSFTGLRQFVRCWGRPHTK